MRRAVADKMQVVGALNNDMIGWANDYRLDNTIRYSNPGIRDIQHAAAMQFTQPDHLRRAVLQGHRCRRLLRGLRRHRRRHRVVSGARQSALPPAARLARDDQPPARDRGGEDDRGHADAARVEPVALEGSEGRQLSERDATLSWKPSPEKGVTGYIVAYGPPGKRRGATGRSVAKPDADGQVPAGTIVSVKAMNSKGLEGWDWARRHSAL